MTCPGDSSLLKFYLNSSISLYAWSNLSLMHTISRSLSSWSKLLEEVTTPGRGVLVILLTGSTPFSLSKAQLTLSAKSYGCFKVATICWCISSERVNFCPQFRCTGMAFKAARVLSISVREFSCLASYLHVSSSTSKYKVILIASLSNMLTVKNLSCV